jgi:hypothetical protein
MTYRRGHHPHSTRRVCHVGRPRHHGRSRLYVCRGVKRAEHRSRILQFSQVRELQRDANCMAQVLERMRMLSTHRNSFIFNCKGKAIHVTGRRGPQGCETSRLPRFLDNLFKDGGDVRLMHQLPFTPRDAG